MRKFILFCLVILQIASVSAQNPSTEKYNPLDFYLPAFNPPAGNPFRSANGSPGPMYWQNKADYTIHATIDDKNKSIKGDVTISYANNSPDKLDYLWLQLDQNLFKTSSRGTATTSVAGNRFDTKGFNGGINITSATITSNGKSYKAET